MNRRSPRGEPAIRSPDTGGTSSMPAGGTTGERPDSNKKSGTKSPTRFRTRSAPRPPRSRPFSPTCTRRCPTTCVISGTPSSPPAGGERTPKKGPAAPVSAPSSASWLQRAHELFKQGRAKEALALVRPLLQREGRGTPTGPPGPARRGPGPEAVQGRSGHARAAPGRDPDRRSVRRILCHEVVNMPAMTMVQAINNALREEMRRDDRVIVLGEDVGRNGGVFRCTEGLLDEFPERV